MGTKFGFLLHEARRAGGQACFSSRLAPLGPARICVGQECHLLTCLLLGLSAEQSLELSFPTTIERRKL